MIYLAPILCTYALWLLFLAVMALNWRWRALPKVVKAIALPAVLVSVALDVLFNAAAGVNTNGVKVYGGRHIGGRDGTWPATCIFETN